MNMQDQTSDDGHSWRVCGWKTTQSHIVFICQMVLIYIVILTCILNLSLKNGDSNLWTALLSSCLGYILPAPSIKESKKNSLSRTP